MGMWKRKWRVGVCEWIEEKQERKWMMVQEEIDCRAGGRGGGWPPGRRQVGCINPLWPGSGGLGGWSWCCLRMLNVVKN